MRRLICLARPCALALCALIALASPAFATCTWGLMSSPSVGAANQLRGVAGASSSDVWSVGESYTQSGVASTLAEHWNGTAWSVVKTPNPDPAGGQLYAAAAVSSTDVWAVGYGEAASGAVPLVLHWGGKLWTHVTAPSVSGKQSVLESIWALNSKDIWASGTAYGSSPDLLAPLVEHWDGTKWSIVSTPNAGAYGSDLNGGITGSATNDVWAVGASATNAQTSNYLTFTEHWNGTKWSIVSSPNANTIDDLFNGVTEVSSSDVWAVGNYYTGSVFHTLAAHWNGKAWALVKMPSPGTSGDGLFGAAAFSADNVWAVGEEYTSGGSLTLSLKWNGKAWSVVKTPNVSGGNPDLFWGAAAIPNSTTLWAVGWDLYPSNTYPDLTLTASNACTAADNGGDGYAQPPATARDRAQRHFSSSPRR